MTCPLCERVRAAEFGDHELVIAQSEYSLVVLGDNQDCAGWCVVILKEHREHMAELAIGQQERIFADVARVAAGIRGVFGPVRINYECLGNQVPHVHWHVIPRHADDREPSSPVWGWPAEVLRGAMTDAARVELVGKLRKAMAASSAEG